MKRNKGFTLIELIGVIALVSILLGFSGMSLYSLFDAKTDAFAKDIGNFLVEARYKNMAYADSYYVEIIYDSVEDKYIANLHKIDITSDEIIKSSKSDKGCKVKFHESLELNVVPIAGLPDGKLLIKFKSNGSVSDNSGIIIITRAADTHGKKILINRLTGKVAVSNAN